MFRVASIVGQTSLTAVALGLAIGCAQATDTPTPTTPAPPAEKTLDASGELVAIGDLHGDLDNAVRTLQLVGLVDAQGDWSGGTRTLVQTGDTTDRGPDSREVMDLMRKLQRQAKQAGGQVIPLLGNHEIMNLHGDWRYVSPEDVAHFGGVEQRKAAFAPDGVYGKWLRTLDVVAKVEDTVFVHGGIAPPTAALGTGGVNDAVHRSLFVDPQAPVLGNDGPVWFRGYALADEAAACPALTSALAGLEARRMVVGHTVQRDGEIRTRCGGRLVLIDIGIADGYGGNLGAWVWSKGDTKAIYPEKIVDLEDPGN